MKWACREYPQGFDTSFVIGRTVHDAGTMYPWPEATSARVDKLLEIVYAMADLLPEDKQKELIERVAYGWSPKV